MNNPSNSPPGCESEDIDHEYQDALAEFMEAAETAEEVRLARSLLIGAMGHVNDAYWRGHRAGRERDE